MEREENIKGVAHRIGKIVANVVTIVVGILLVIGSLSTLNWGIEVEGISRFRYLLSGLQGVVLIIGVGNLIWGTTIKTVMRKFEVRVAGWFERKLQGIMK